MFVLVFTDSDQHFDIVVSIEHLGFKSVSNGDLEILLDNADDASSKYVVTHSFRSLPLIMQLSLS